MSQFCSQFKFNPDAVSLLLYIKLNVKTCPSVLLAWGGCRLVAVLYHTPTHPLHVGCGVVRCVELTKVMEVCGVVWCGVVWCGVVWCGVVSHLDGAVPKA